MNHRRYLQQVGLLLSATAIAQLINFAAYPLLSRTYDSLAFGYFSIFVSAASIVGPLACGRFDVVVQASPHAQRFAALRLANFISVPVAALSALVYASYGPETRGMAEWLIATLFGFSVWLIAFCSSGTAFLVKHEAYRQNGMAIISRAIFTVLPQLLLFWAMPDVRGLILGFCVGMLAQALVTANGMLRLGLRRAGRRQLGTMLRRYKQYPLYDVPSTFLSAIVLFSSNFFLFNLYGPQQVGYFAFAFRLAALPMTLLATSLSQVFFEKAAKSFQQNGGYWSPLRFNLIVSGILAVTVFILTLFFARFAVLIYLGNHWSPVAEILIILAPMMASRFVFIAISSAPLVTGQPRWLLVANGVLVLAIVGIFVLANIINISFEAYLSMFSLSTTSIYSGLVLFISIKTYRNYRENCVNA